MNEKGRNRTSYSRRIFNEYLRIGYGTRPKEMKRMFEIYDFNYRKHLPGRRSRILEIGCGMGHFLHYLKESGYTNFAGVEVGRESFEYCREYVTDRVVLVEETEDYLRRYRNEFDAIVMNSVIEHMSKEEVVSLLEAVRDSLSERGVLILLTPNLSNPFAVTVRYGDFTHEVGFTERSIVEVLKTVGFPDVRVLPIKRPIRTPWRLVRITLQKVMY